MLKIIYTGGWSDSTIKLKTTNLTGDATVDRNNSYVKSLVAGKLATIDADGFVALASDTDEVEGFIINDASGYEFENIPALASGVVPVLVGGGVVVTDQVVESDIVPGNKLYASNGMVTKTAPSENATVIGVARSANSASDKSLTVKFY